MTTHHYLPLEERTREEIVASLAELWRGDNPGSAFTDHVRLRLKETAERNLRIAAHFKDMMIRERLGLAVCGNPSDKAYSCLDERGIAAADWMRGLLLHDLQLVIGNLRDEGLLRRDSDIDALRNCLTEMGDLFQDSALLTP